MRAEVLDLSEFATGLRQMPVYELLVLVSLIIGECERRLGERLDTRERLDAAFRRKQFRPGARPG
jgi:hypothetical protein